MSNGLTRSEVTRKNQLISRVKSGLETFLAVGRDLLALQKEGLYKDTHKSFERFMADEFGLQKSLGYYYIKAAEVHEKLSTIVETSDMPAAIETHYRELARAPEEKLPEVVQRAAELAESKGRDEPTAKDYKAVVNAVLVDEPSGNGEPVYEDVPDEPDPNAWKIPRSQSVKAAEALRRHVADLCRARRRVGKRDRVLELTDEALQILKGW